MATCTTLDRRSNREILTGSPIDAPSEELKKYFPKPPEWDKVQDNVVKIATILDKADLSFTEKFQILDLTTKMYEREFYHNSMMLFLEHLNEVDKEQSKKSTEHIYS